MSDNTITYHILNHPCLTYENDTIVPNNVSTIMIHVDKNGEEYVRMIKENINGREYISLPGGKYEKTDSDSLSAAMREYKEETTDSEHPDNNTEFEYHGRMTVSYKYAGITKYTLHHIMRTYDAHKMYSGPLNNGETNHVAWVNVNMLLDTMKKYGNRPHVYIKYDGNKSYPLRGCMKDTLKKFI